MRGLQLSVSSRVNMHPLAVACTMSRAVHGMALCTPLPNVVSCQASARFSRPNTFILRKSPTACACAEDLAQGSLLDQCSFLGYMREEPFLLNRAVKGRDTMMRVPTMALSLLVQRMVGLEASKRAEAEAEVARLRALLKARPATW